MVSSAVLAGYGESFMAAVAFGTMYIPIKHYPTFDGSVFQWYMCSGIMIVGVLADTALGHQPIINAGMLGGFFWSASNFMVIPTVKLLGLGVGFALYHCINMILGYSIGRFGLFGAHKEDVTPVADFGLGLLCVSLVLMIWVEPHIESVEETPPPRTTQPPTSLLKQAELSLAASAANRMGGPSGSSMSSASMGEQQPLLPVVKQAPQLELAELPLRPSPKKAKPEAKRVKDDLELGRSSVDAGSQGFRSGYSNWRQGRSRGAVTSSQGIVGGKVVARSSGLKRSSSRSSLLGSERMASVGDLSTFNPVFWEEHHTLRMTANSSHLLPTPEDAGMSSATRVAGVLCGVVAGVLAGLNMLPFAVYQTKHPDADPQHFFFSMTMGVYVSSTAFYVLYAAVMQLSGVEVQQPAIPPAFTSGVIWAVGQYMQILAISVLGMTQGYVYDAIGPVMISAVISAVVFNEIVGFSNRVMFGIALTLQLTGVTLVSIGQNAKG